MAEISCRNGIYKIRVYLGKHPKTGKKITESTTYTPTKKTPKAIEKEVEEYAREFDIKSIFSMHVETVVLLSREK